MKADLAPNHIQRLDRSYLLWFRHTNTYTVISEELKHILDIYVKAENEADCISILSEHSELNELELNRLVSDVSRFLEASNSVSTQNSISYKHTEIPKPVITTFYNIRNFQIQVNYGSAIIKSLLHPQLSHLLVDNVSKTDAIFDVFQNKDHLFLFKNAIYMGSYETQHFNLLQGKFALEIMNVVYNKTEADWLATFHASTVSNTEEAIMIVGNSGNGKSTLSALLMAHGFDVLADDVTPILAKDLMIYRNPTGISVKKGAFDTLKPLIPNFNSIETHFNGPKKKEIKYLPNILGLSSVKQQMPCDKIVYVNYSKDTISELKKVSSEKILEILIPESWISPQPDHSKLFLKWLTGLSFYELSYNDNNFAISEFKALFNS